MTKLDKKNMPFLEPFETDCDPCLAPECPHTAQCIKQLQAKNKYLQAELEHLKKRIEFAVDYLPDCPDKAMAFLTPVLKKGG